MPSVGSFQHPSPQVPPQRINALHVPQMRCDGAAPGVIAPHGRRRDSVQIKFAGAPTPLPGLHSGVCHWLSSIPSSGLPEAPLESRSWLARSVIAATFDGPHPAEPVLIAPQEGGTPVIVLTRACGRVAPVTRGSDALAHGFPDGARTRRTGPPTPRSRDAPTGIRSAAVSRPAPNFTHSLWHRRRVGLAVPQISGSPSASVRMGRRSGVFLLLISDDTRSLDTGTRRSWLSFTTFTHWSGPPVLGGPCRGRTATGPSRVRRPRGDAFLRHSVRLHAL